MKEYVTYCSECDARVVVRVPAQRKRPLAPADLTCLDRVASCTPATCPLCNVDAGELCDRLEFLPPELVGDNPRGFDEAVELVEKSRRAAVRRNKGYPGASEG